MSFHDLISTRMRFTSIDINPDNIRSCQWCLSNKTQNSLLTTCDSKPQFDTQIVNRTEFVCHLIFTLPCFAHTHSVHMLTPYSLVCVLPRFQSTDFVISHVARKTQRLQFYIIVQEFHVHVTSVRAGGNESLPPKNGRA